MKNGKKENKILQRKQGNGYKEKLALAPFLCRPERMEGADNARGERMNKMSAALDKAMAKTLNSCTQKLFLESYPANLTTKHQDVFLAAHKRFLTVLATNIKVPCPCREGLFVLYLLFLMH